MDLKNLQRPRVFYDEHRNLFTSYKAFRYRLEARASNGLIKSGAVVDTPFGPLIDPEAFRQFLLQDSGEQRAA